MDVGLALSLLMLESREVGDRCWNTKIGQGSLLAVLTDFSTN